MAFKRWLRCVLGIHYRKPFAMTERKICMRCGWLQGTKQPIATLRLTRKACPTCGK